MSFHRINCCKKDDLNCDAFVPGANAEPVGGKVCGVSPELATFNFKSIILADLMHSSVSGKYHTVTLDKGPFSVLVNNGTSGTHDYNVVIGSMKVYTDAAGTTLDATVDVSARVYIKNDASQMKLVIKATYSSHDYFLFAAAYGYNNINFGGWIFGCPTMDTEIVDGAFSDVDGASEVGAAADILLRLCGACSSPDMWLFKFSGLRPYCSADTTTLVSNFDDVVNGKTFACVANPFGAQQFFMGDHGLIESTVFSDTTCSTPVPPPDGDRVGALLIQFSRTGDLARTTFLIDNYHLFFPEDMVGFVGVSGAFPRDGLLFKTEIVEPSLPFETEVYPNQNQPDDGDDDEFKEAVGIGGTITTTPVCSPITITSGATPDVFSDDGGEGSFDFTTDYADGPWCTAFFGIVETSESGTAVWVGNNPLSFVTVTSATIGKGSGTTTYTVDPNPTGAYREQQIIRNRASVLVRQGTL